MALIQINPQIPATSTNTSQDLTLDGAPVRLVTKYLGGHGWCFDLFDGDGAALVQSVRLVAGIDLLSQYKAYPGVPQGALFVWWAGGGQQQDPTQDSFANGDAQLFYNEVES